MPKSLIGQAWLSHNSFSCFGIHFFFCDCTSTRASQVQQRSIQPNYPVSSSTIYLSFSVRKTYFCLHLMQDYCFFHSRLFWLAHHTVRDWWICPHQHPPPPPTPPYQLLFWLTLLHRPERLYYQMLLPACNCCSTKVNILEHVPEMGHADGCWWRLCTDTIHGWCLCAAFSCRTIPQRCGTVLQHHWHRTEENPIQNRMQRESERWVLRVISKKNLASLLGPCKRPVIQCCVFGRGEAGWVGWSCLGPKTCLDGWRWWMLERDMLQVGYSY